jgi:hypothetical protein
LIGLGVLVLTLLVITCSPYRQPVGPSSGSTRVTLDQLVHDQQQYFIYHNTRIVVFDPIENDRTIKVGRDWVLIEDAQQLTEIINRLALNPRIDPEVIYEIRGPVGDLFGYAIYAAGDLVSVNSVDPGTVRLTYNPQREPDGP